MMIPTAAWICWDRPYHQDVRQIRFVTVALILSVCYRGILPCTIASPKLIDFFLVFFIEGVLIFNPPTLHRLVHPWGLR